MKKSILIIMILAFSFVQAKAIDFDYAVRAGASTTQLDFEKDIYDNCGVGIANAGKIAGFHIGMMGELSIPLIPVSVIPEVLFSFNGGAMDVENIQIEETYNITQRFGTIDIPLLVAYNVGPIRLEAGPIAHISLFDNEKFKDIIKKKFDKYSVEDIRESAAVGYQIAVGVKILDILRAELKYEGNFSSNGIEFNDNKFETDLRSTQVILSLGYVL